VTGSGAIDARVLRFARALRDAGVPVGPGRVLDALSAAAEVGLRRRDDLYWALHAVLVSRSEDRALFEQAFRLLWDAPDALPDGLELLLPRSPAPRERVEVSRRLADALGREEPAPRRAAPDAEAKVDAVLAWSGREVLKTNDFEQMSAEELREAERAVAALALPVEAIPTRRWRADPRGDRVDPRATLRAMLRSGSGWIPLRWRSYSPRPPLIVALVDVSGSMARYSRMLLRFLHALAREHRSVHAFTFATHLTNVSRHLRHRDPDLALAAIGQAVRDWEGGTRIGAALREFNLRWGRRLLGPGAVVLLVTDGLDRDDARGLAEETGRLRRSCRRLLWLNPLLRYEAFEPRAAGIRSMLPHVDDFLPVHDLRSVGQLAGVLSGSADAGRKTGRSG
jgi:uncharacterized protein with von Willebrand factor type A (vWA) domain